MRIVIVEDEVKIREGMGKLIASHTDHIIVGEAVNGEEGLEMILRFKPNLVITDIRMPKMDGLTMIKELYERKIPIHTVILSGYSEFDYAKKAIRYGVDDYLLKPLAAEDVKDMLDKVNDKIIAEDQLLYGAPETLMKDLLFGNVEENEEGYQKLKQACGLKNGLVYEMMAGYIGNAEPEYRQKVEKRVEELKVKFKSMIIYLFYRENEQIFYCLAVGERKEDFLKWEESFYRRMIAMELSQMERPAWAKEIFNDYTMLKNIGKILKSYLSYALVLGDEIWITKENVARYEPEEFVYPADVNNKMKNAVCQGSQEGIINAAKLFIKYMKEHRFDAADIHQAFSKSYFLIMDTLQDIDQSLYGELQSANVLQLMADALTWKELENAYGDIVRILTGPKVRREDISNYVIKKAINYIREHFQEGITQEEVSRKLEITPEYLSTLFNREMGINFSTFLKQFRISHAKRLLKGTDLKIYEIAKAVGYHDSKYFARVFKEEQGISPAEYRQIN